MGLLTDLGIDLPVLAAPMAGGPGTPELVLAAAEVGSLGFLAAGYKTAAEVAAEIATVRTDTDRFGVNVFAPSPLPVDPAGFRRYAEQIASDAASYDLDLADAEPREDDDYWQDKIDLLLAAPVPIVSFTFGLPPVSAIEALRRAGSIVAQTVTALDEVIMAVDRGVDVLVVQSAAGGGHSGTLHPRRPIVDRPIAELVASIAASVSLPIVAAGGLAAPDQVTAVMRAGAQAVAVGTALLRTPEAGTSAVHRAALADPARESVITHAFTGRPARGLRNEFIDRYETSAPLGYPALHHLTSPMRKAAAAADDPERVNLWAGTGFRLAADAPASEILRHLVSDI